MMLLMIVLILHRYYNNTSNDDHDGIEDDDCNDDDIEEIHMSKRENGTAEDNWVKKPPHQKQIGRRSDRRINW